MIASSHNHNIGIMKKTAITTTLLCTAVAGAQAQSSVTILGVADSAVRYVNNQGGSSQWSLVSGSNQTSRIVLQGTEDLGGGLHAGFWLESGLNLDSGTNANPSQFFDRASYVSLRSESAGEIRLGRDRTQVYRIWSAGDPFGTVGVGSVVALYPPSGSTLSNPVRSAFGTNDRNATTSTRSNNMIAWSLPRVGGLAGGLYYAPDEGDTAINSSRSLRVAGGSLGYVAGALSIMAGYSSTKAPVSTGGTFKDRVVHAIYDFGPVKLSLAQRQYKYIDALQVLSQIGAWVPVGVGTFKVSMGQLNNKGTVAGTSINTADVRSLGFGYEHNLSKRTALYGTFGMLDNGAGVVTAFSGGAPGMPPGGKSRAMEVGIRHSF